MFYPVRENCHISTSQLFDEREEEEYLLSQCSSRRSVSIVWRCRTTGNIDDVSSRSGFAWMRPELGLRPAPFISTDSPVHESASFWRSLRLRPSTQQRLWHSAARWRVSVSASWLPPQEVRYLPSSNYNFGSSDDAGACTHTDCWLYVCPRANWRKE